jgi:hypothetical protein
MTLLAGSFVALLGIALLVYYSGARHAGMIGLAMIAACWMAASNATLRPNRAAHIVIVMVLAVSCLQAMFMWQLEWRYAFSAAREMSRFIQTHEFDDYTIAAFPDPVASSVLPDLSQQQFWYAGLQRYASHMPWNRAMIDNRKIEFAWAMQRIEAAFPRRDKLLVLLNKQIIDPRPFGYRLVYATQSTVYRHVDERYWLYEWVGRPLWFSPGITPGGNPEAVSPAPRAGER